MEINDKEEYVRDFNDKVLSDLFFKLINLFQV